MKYNNFYKKILITSILGFVFTLNYSFVYAATSFSFNAPEGQGVGNNEFYHGRCVRVDVMLDTDGQNTGGADLEINYDNTRIGIVNNDCATAATTIYPDNQYDNYPNNHVTANKITLGAYNNPGNIYNGSERFASFYFTVLDGLGDYDLDFEFTLNDTTDTNLAEFGTGNEILDQANNFTLHFTDDNNIPYINNLNPINNTTNVQVISNILYRLNDDDAGINFSTLIQSLAGANWGTTNYTSASGQISHTCHTTNANRVPYCDTTLNPSNNLWYCETYTVDTTISDLGNPTVHTLSNYTYSFDTEPDNDPVEVYNQNPNNGAVNIPTVSNVAFNLRDLANPGSYPGTGVDISTLSVNVSAPGWGNQTYTTASPELTATPINTNDYGNVYDYSIVVNPASDFPENTIVTVTVNVDDYGCPIINHQNLTYTFTTADTQGPVCTLFTPTPGVVNVGTGDNVTFHCTDNGVGININTITAQVNNIIYTASGVNQFTYTGDPADYFIIVNPITDFSIDYALEVIVNAKDFSNNVADQVSFGLATGTTGNGGGGGGGSCPICKTCDICDTCDTCDTCEDTVTTITKTITNTEYLNKYKECQIIKKIDNSKLVVAETKNLNTLINSIILKKINNFDSRKELIVTVTENKVFFEGTALPNSLVTLMIESDPIIITGLANDDGIWKIEMENIFINGIHKVSAITLSDDNYIIKTKHLANFIVKRYKNSWWCWLLLILLFLLILYFYKRYKNMKNKFKKLKRNKLKQIQNKKYNK